MLSRNVNIKAGDSTVADIASRLRAGQPTFQGYILGRDKKCEDTGFGAREASFIPLPGALPARVKLSIRLQLVPKLRMP